MNIRNVEFNQKGDIAVITDYNEFIWMVKF
jgi:hypothetical protein